MVLFFIYLLFYICTGIYYPLFTMDNSECNFTVGFTTSSVTKPGIKLVKSDKDLSKYYIYYNYYNDSYSITVKNSIPLSITIENRDKNKKLNLNDTELAALMNHFLAKKYRYIDDDGICCYYSVENNIEPFFTKNNQESSANKIFLECYKNNTKTNSRSFLSFDFESKIIARLIEHNSILISSLYEIPTVDNEKITLKKEATIKTQSELEVDSFLFYKEQEQLYLIVCSYIKTLSKNTCCIDFYNLTNLASQNRSIKSTAKLEQERLIIQNAQNSGSILKILSINDGITFLRKENNQEQVVNICTNTTLTNDFLRIVKTQDKYIYGLKIMYFWKSYDNTAFFATDEMLKIFPQPPSDNVQILKNTYPCFMPAQIEQPSPHKKEEIIREQKSKDKPTTEQENGGEKQPSATIYNLLKSLLCNNYIKMSFGTTVLLFSLIFFYNY